MKQVTERRSEKEAIVVVSFGTSYPDTRKTTIEAVEQRITEAFPGFSVRRAFTSRHIIRKMAEQEGIEVDNLAQALERLHAEGFRTVIVQPTHLIPGEEWDRICLTIASCRERQLFACLLAGTPLLYTDEDYARAVDALKPQLPELAADEAVLLMGHGSPQRSGNEVYEMLQKFLNKELPNVLVGTVEASPALADLIPVLQDKAVKRVVLMPYLLVAGDHACNDMAGDGANSWKTVLREAGFEVEVYMRGLGENPAYREMYVAHIRRALAGGSLWQK